MTFCRSCCGGFWGGTASELNTQRTIKSSASASTVAFDEEAVVALNQASDEDFRPHTEANAIFLSKKWITHVQKRVAKVWDRDYVLSLLQTIAQSVSFSDDPITGDPSPSAPCVQWHGDVSKEQGLPVIHVRSSNNTDTPTYVSKLLSFLFADDESLKVLKQAVAGSFSMNCGNSQCIRLSHLVGYTTKWASKYKPKDAEPPKRPPKSKKAPPKAK